MIERQADRIRDNKLMIGPKSFLLLETLAAAYQQDCGVLDHGVTLATLGEVIYPEGVSPGRLYRNMLSLIARFHRSLEDDPLGTTVRLTIRRSTPLIRSRCIPNKAAFEYFERVRSDPAQSVGNN